MHLINLNWLDGLVIGAYFLLILFFGLHFRRSTNTSSQFFHAGRSLPAWITGIAFVAANCGALEVMGIVSTSAKYGARANSFYWIGAIPAMLFLALFMMPIYFRSRALSVPEFLRLRYDERTRVLNAVSFAVLMILVSGISLYAMAIILRAALGWRFGSSVLLGAIVVLIYVSLGGLKATIYNEVLQFVLLLAGLLPLVYLILRSFHGFRGIRDALPPNLGHTWKMLPIADPSGSPIDVIGVVFGLGFVLSCGYWCTDFLLIQRALAAKDLKASVETPLVGAVAKLFFPLLVVLPGLASIVLFPVGLASRYDLALPALFSHYYGHGLLGLGITAMLASFMSGMAGNITAFNTVWTHDLYAAYIARNKADSHYVMVGRIATIVASLLSVVTAYFVLRFNSLMDYVQLLFSFFNAPLFATFLLGMFTKWATPSGGFCGLLAGTGTALIHHLLYSYGRVRYGSDMTANFYGAMYAWGACFLVTCGVSLFTTAKPLAELQGVVYQRGAVEDRTSTTLRSPWVMASIIAVVCVVLNWLFR
jgi:solute:Na+ symporter, SSS family